MRTTDRKQIGFALAAVAIVAAAFLLFWWKGAFLENVVWREKESAWTVLEAKLKDRTFGLYRNDTKIWGSEWDWSVQDFCLADIDSDGAEELLLLVWKRGSYGDHRPFWVKRNDCDCAQHIFIYRQEPERDTYVRAIWMSSALPPILEMETDGERIYITDPDGSVSSWRWEGFGLKLEQEKCLTMSVLACGDQLLHKSVLLPGFAEDNYEYMYDEIRSVVASADLASLNHETPLVFDKQLVSDYPRFGSPLAVADAVRSLGIDVVTTANNHALDQEMYGVDTTIRAYEERGIVPVGTHGTDDPADDFGSAVTFIEKNGIKTALLAFTYGTNGIVLKDYPHAVERLSEETRMTRALDRAREQADLVIVYAHWGTEYSEDIDGEQKQFTKLFLDHGVDVVIGTHPHVLQPYEVMKQDGHRMLVYYSLGNLISAQTQENTKHGWIASFTVIKNRDRDVSVVKSDLLKIRTEHGSVKWER